MVTSIARSDSARMYVGSDELYDVVHRSSGLKDCCDTEFFQGFHILIGNDSADHDQNIVHLVLAQQVHYARHDRVMRARKNGEANHMHIFLQRRIDDHLWSLAQAGVDDFHAGVAQRAGDYLCAAIVAIEAGFSNQNPNLSWLIHRLIVY